MGAPSPLRRRVAWAALAAALLLAARLALFGDYRVETASMEPFLYGSPKEGDRVLVLRKRDLARTLRRFDPIVFRTPDGAHAIKRAVGLPGDTIQVAEGEIFLDGAPLRKSEAETEAMLVPVFDSASASWESLWRVPAEGWRIERDGSLLVEEPPAGGEAARLLTRRSILDEYPDRHGALVPGRIVVEDLALRVDWEPLGEGGGFALLLHRTADAFEFRIDREGGAARALLRRVPAEGPAVTLAEGPLRAIPPGSAVSVEAFDVDGRLRWIVDGREALPAVDVDVRSPSATNGGGPLRGSGATILAHELRARIRRARLRRDVHYVAEGAFAIERPLVLGPDEVFLLGDNSRASLDGREWGPVPLSRAIGVPFLVYWPLGRVRFP